MTYKWMSALSALGASLYLAGPAAVAATPWPANASGANARFGWSGGEYNTGRFGSPNVTVNGFFFNNPNNFLADTTVTSVTDFARVTVNVLNASPVAAPPITDIVVREFGTFSGDPADLNLQADFSIFRFPPDMPPGATGSLSLPNDATIFNIAAGTWFTERTLSVGDPLDNPPLPSFLWNVPVHVFQITVTNTLQVSGNAPPGTFFEKTGMDIIIPEPGTLTLIACLAPVALWRGRHRRRGRHAYSE